MVEPGFMAARTQDARLARKMAEVDLKNDLDLFGGLVADSSALKELAGPGGLNTDDLPIVTFSPPPDV